MYENVICSQIFRDSRGNLCARVETDGFTIPFGIVDFGNASAIVTADAWKGFPAIEAEELHPGENPYARVVETYHSVELAEADFPERVVDFTFDTLRNEFVRGLNNEFPKPGA